ncbi:putative membrane protein, putative virulence factor [Xenococcus sp. PCC 7305]|uniref:murein biosynthesis integral membrane protein MurJ n=1 Tax=Xenococcus sp. PCC 7305 TaxID=102125 RepID=UPI0002ABEABE|nr:murein biosynthesis integral membrane protein MurJ [Xenococcus sp. PCC 7305]ELS03855.1 putative membrane protein, putative virulence factor [Xenococcus sp. PCC 7305]
MRTSWLNYWQKLTTSSIDRQIFSAAFTVAVFTAVVKLASIVKEILVAWQFGTDDSLDAFFIALVIPSLAINVVAGSLNAAFIPTYIRVRDREGFVSAQKLFANTSIFSSFLLVLATLTVATTAPCYLKVIASGFPPEKLELTCKLLWSIAPLICLSGIRTIWGAVLNAWEKFALAAVAPILTPLVSIVLLYSFPGWGVFALTIGLLMGTLLELVILAVILRKQKLIIYPRWSGLDANLRQIINQYIPAAAGALLICSAMPIDQSMAAMLSPGSVAALNYGNRLIASPISLLSTALGTAVIPYFSKMIAAENWQDLQGTLRKYLGLIFAGTVPLAIGLMVFSKPIIELMLQRGSFTATDTQMVVPIQTLYALQIPFYLANILLVRLINSLNQNKTLFYLSAANLTINVVLNYLFMQWLGIIGIALSTSCVYIFSFLYALVFTHRALKTKVTQFKKYS